MVRGGGATVQLSRVFCCGEGNVFVLRFGVGMCSLMNTVAVCALNITMEYDHANGRWGEQKGLIDLLLMG